MIVGFIAGIGIQSYITIPIVILLGIGLMAMVALACAWRRKKKHVAVAALVFLACVAGISRMRYAQTSIPDLTAFSDRHIMILGTVTQHPRLIKEHQIVLLDVKEIDRISVTSPVVVSVMLRNYPRYKLGDIIASRGMFEAKPYNGITNGMLFSSYQEKRGEEDAGVFFGLLFASKEAFNAHIDSALPEPHASFMKGLLLGERAAMPADLVQKFKQAGVSHIVALSGYNITLVGALLVDVLLLMTIPFRAAFWIAGSSIVLFVLLTGAQASVVRAAIMGILVLVAAREGRMYHMTNALIFAGATMLSIHPYLLRFDVGFQLSFLATIGLIYLTALVDRMLGYIEYRARILLQGKRLGPQKEHRIVNGVKKILSETIAAQLAVLPLLAYLFGGVSVIAPVSNLFVLAAIPYAMILGFFTGALGFIWQPMSITAGWLAWIVLQYELGVINFFSTMSFSFISISSVGTIFIIITYGIAGFIWWKRG